MTSGGRFVGTSLCASPVPSAQEQMTSGGWFWYLRPASIHVCGIFALIGQR